MSWTTSVNELRELLNDQGNDRLRYRKRCLGRTDSSNKKFQTLEFRRVTDLDTATAPFGVYVNDSIVSVTADDMEVGEFTLASAPGPNDEVRATYYYQWFLDSELESFLTDAAEWLGLGSTALNVPPGLQSSALYHAAGDAYYKLALRWNDLWSQVYKLEDAPKEPEKVVKAYADTADDLHDRALKFRDNYYTRQGQALSPRFQIVTGQVRDPMPKR